jgi:predicted metal-dependent peptidase
MNKAESLAKASKDLMLKEPFYGLFLMTLNKVWDTKIPTACVQLRGINTELKINSDFWNELPPDHKMGVLKHELLHIAFFHLTTFRHLLKKNRDVANVAMDIEINQYITNGMLPESALSLDTFPELNLEPKKGTMYYFEKLLDNEDLVKERVKNMGDYDHDWSDMEALDEATQKIVETQVGRVLGEIANHVEKTTGNVPGEMQELIKRLKEIEPPKFDWRGYIKRFHGKSIKVFTKKSRRKYNKRTPDFPGLKIKQRKHILVGIDTSGSVNTAELKEFLNEMHHMYKTGSEVTIVQCDTAISHVGKFDPNKDLEIHGRGGTDFQPVIDYYNEHFHRFSCLMYLTDGEAPAPDNAKGNILWVLSSQSKMNDNLPGAVIKLN